MNPHPRRLTPPKSKFLLANFMKVAAWAIVVFLAVLEARWSDLQADSPVSARVESLWGERLAAWWN